MRSGIICLLILLVPGSLFAFWPVYWELDGQKNFFGPLVTYEKEEEKTHVTVRAFLSSYDSPRTYSILFPLGKSTEEKSYFVPLYASHRDGARSDWAFFPFFGGTTGERSYGGVFPFYGKLYERFRRDEIGFVMWPLYGWSKWNGTTRTNVVWPIFSFYKGYQEGFKIGPLYGQRRWGTERRSRFVLWPFFIRDEKDLDTDNPKSSYWAVPFYMQTKSPQSTFYGVLYPFFSYLRVPDRTDINAPWPFFTYTTGKEWKSVGVWPVYSRTKRQKDEYTYFLWPLYKRIEQYPAADKRWVEQRVLLINKYIADNRGTFFNIWPFMEYRHAGEETNFFFPSVIPWRNPNFDRIVRPLLTLYEYKGEGEKRQSNLLYGFYTKEQKGETWRRRLAFLFEVKREPEGYGFQLLSGLFGVDAKRVKLFYIPIRRDGYGAAPTPPLSQGDPTHQ